MDYSEEQKFHDDRMVVYRFLSLMYKTAPSLALIESFLAMDNETPTPMDACIKEMRGKDPEQLRIDLAAEYNRVFLNMGPDPVYPYESVYTSPEHMLMQDARDEVLALYRAEGLTSALEVNIPEDHLSFELDFMAYLCEQAALAYASGNLPGAGEYSAKQKTFIKEHLLNWVPEMCRDMDRRVHTEFYKSLCAITKEHLEAEREWLAEQ